MQGKNERQYSAKQNALYLLSRMNLTTTTTEQQEQQENEKQQETLKGGLTKSQQQRSKRRQTRVLDTQKIADCLTDSRFLPPPHLRLKQTFSMSSTEITSINLREIIVDIFNTSSVGVIADETNDLETVLTNLHRHPGLALPSSSSSSSSSSSCTTRKPQRHRAVRSPFQKAYRNVCCNKKEGIPALVDLKKRYAVALKQFARVVLAPMLEVDPNDVLYQAIPVLRVSHPSTKCMGKLHTDYESNNHQPAELNFWIPLCRAFGNNTLYVESTPNANDFEPIELEYGQGMRFWGNQVRHHAVVNNTDTTRVSLDLRAMARETYNVNFVDKRGQPLQRRIGEFYLESSM